ncbi:Succinate dehydrogenase assembly factor 2, mitochondrial [Lachnellula hyalina]|uniref:Succinate dehydrogenase assembly factor 2, mitochondrial n=1 Tax=Lachnellula hyalina TaxID=1316788 RepID=A0A8H8QYA8_9HELO|nr:Succinate dehydrogenase assembly factor 2, mitochondrial [Lachnellula hyalina]TVY25093.1 Succinate dehydrogenase assembly factor 2, mitochondrial [Lachnellula hyalina]
MSSARLILRSVRPSMAFTRPISMTARRLAGPGNSKEHETAAGHRKIQTEKPLNPHMTNTTSTIANDMPSAGARKAPPELLTSVDADFVPKDSVPENTERMTGGTQKAPEDGPNAEMGVGQMEGAKFKIEPLRRTGEDANTTRARLLYQSRKRGTLESDLLMSTFAEAHLRDMTPAQMAQFDLFLDENDWDIYYWATQEPTPTSQETAEGAGRGPEGATANAQGTDKEPKLETDEWRQGSPRSGEWAQTIGTFKPAYRPVPTRWKNSEILAMLRRHVISRSAGGIHEEPLDAKSTGGGMAFMPPVFSTDRP